MDDRVGGLATSRRHANEVAGSGVYELLEAIRHLVGQTPKSCSARQQVEAFPMTANSTTLNVTNTLFVSLEFSTERRCAIGVIRPSDTRRNRSSDAATPESYGVAAEGRVVGRRIPAPPPAVLRGG